MIINPMAARGPGLSLTECRLASPWQGLVRNRGDDE